MKIGIQTKIQTKEVQTKEELYIPVDRGRLVTSLSTGMTIDNINGEIVSTRLSASDDFAQTSFEKRSDGGKAKPKSKVKAMTDKIRKKKEPDEGNAHLIVPQSMWLNSSKRQRRGSICIVVVVSW